MSTSPSPMQLATIANLPENVERPFAEAESNYKAGNLSSAAVMYRKAIERTLKAHYPEGKGMLHQRIRDIEGKAALPHAMIELLDMVKFLGNDGAHDDDDPDKEDVESGREFARLLLTYLWALPAQVAAAKERRARPSA